ncbi:helix-turn-helix transcriptional regulator [Szabonella alba]|uniref:Autoinducer binding domain-containing protein n=1 Tax=Szabonella alba TaxID=2804194 RepID=A0A8K0VBL4_9RHOB|nr:LuxR family transcriptional regulator [Szabonella alba]MBL4917248.1 autoinducer binding domain-containing protein [Szabonella alba]
MPLTRLNDIANSATLDEAWAAATPRFAELGFARVNYGLTRFRLDWSVGDPDDAIYLSTASPEYMRFYFKGGHFSRTPIFRWLVYNTGLTTWRWVEEDYAAGHLSPGETEAVRLNLSLQVRAGLTISFPTQNRRVKAALGLIADPGLDHDDVDRILAQHGAEIEAISHMLHFRIASLPPAYALRRLTDRQREALEWVADGKTTQDIALLMGISAAMVEKHLRLARAALNVGTTAQAVAKGTLLNMIFTRVVPDRSGGEDPARTPVGVPAGAPATSPPLAAARAGVEKTER